MIRKTALILTATISLGYSMDNPLQLGGNTFSKWFKTTITPTFQQLFIPSSQSNQLQLIEPPKPNIKSEFQQKIIQELSLIILGLANEGGLDLKTYRNQVFVCKEWRDLAIKSITILDIQDLMENSPHRKCTLLAHIIADYPIHRFSNLNSLNINFSEVNMIEFHKKINDPEKRIFKKQQDYFSDDRRLDRIENKINMRAKNFQITLENPEVNIVSKVFTAIGGGINLLWNAAWHSQIIGMPFKREEIKNKTDSISGDIEKIILTNLLDLKCLTKLNLGAWDNINLFFLQHMPNLKTFTVKSSSPIFADALGNMLYPHDLESLYLKGSIQLTNFDGWSKFHKLKKLHLNISFVEVRDDEHYNISAPNQINPIIQSLVTNLSQLENLTIGKRLFSNINLCEYISQFPKLKTLNLSSSLLSNFDLMELIKIKTLQKLILPDYLSDKSSIKEMTTAFQGFLTYINLTGPLPFGLVLVEPCTQEGLDSFRLLQPNVTIMFKEDKIIKEVIE